MTTFVSLRDYTEAPAPTFELPSDLERKNLREGTLVKCVFELNAPKEHEHFPERMWIRISQVMPEGVYVGRLMNEPLALPLQYGETITFTWKNVICIAE